MEAPDFEADDVSEHENHTKGFSIVDVNRSVGERKNFSKHSAVPEIMKVSQQVVEYQLFVGGREKELDLRLSVDSSLTSQNLDSENERISLVVDEYFNSWSPPVVCFSFPGASILQCVRV
ncbi:hypothetical protein AVEN_174965-1 [Araneus ventricosus]|uniref:Uncharacterized protein n=1 Tax=Araneus ventricosus TaxID=182803 RepID=A0A4Y2SBW0_ARAVE|nr:hypothetical protein AVEN_174965-1 [Araneus ventricosus]